MKLYLYGMILASNSFLLNEFVKPDEYSEIEKSYRFVGGETGAAATILSSLGAEIVLDGNHIGRNVAPLLKDFYKDKPINMDSVCFDENYDGLEDYILISGDMRTPFGHFGHYFSQAFNGGVRHWNKPKESDIAGCDTAAIDPFFGEESELAAEFCVKHGKPYVTIDCKYDSFMHKNSAVSVISGEFIGGNYPNMTREELFPLYAENGNGLTVITNGGKGFFYGRRGEKMKSFEPYKVNVISTLGAGDSFKAGCTYALSKGMSDDDIVKFASACAGACISRYPMQINPPTLGDIEAIISSENR